MWGVGREEVLGDIPEEETCTGGYGGRSGGDGQHIPRECPVSKAFSLQWRPFLVSPKMLLHSLCGLSTRRGAHLRRYEVDSVLGPPSRGREASPKASTLGSVPRPGQDSGASPALPGRYLPWDGAPGQDRVV